MTASTLETVTRTILEYLSLSGLNDFEPVVEGGEEETEESFARSGGTVAEEDDAPLTTQLKRRALDLIIAQLKDLYLERPRPGNPIVPPSVLTLSLISSSGIQEGMWARFSRVVVKLLYHLVTQHLLIVTPEGQQFTQLDEDQDQLPSGLEKSALLALVETLGILCRDRAFQYLLLRQWQETMITLRSNSGVVETITTKPAFQEFLLRALLQVQNSTLQPNQARLFPPLAALLELWSVLFAHQPLEVPTPLFPHLTNLLVSSLLTAYNQQQLCPQSRFQCPPELVYSLLVLGHAIRGSVSYRNYVRAHNAREKNRWVTSTCLTWTRHSFHGTD